MQDLLSRLFSLLCVVLYNQCFNVLTNVLFEKQVERKPSQHDLLIKEKKLV